MDKEGVDVIVLDVEVCRVKIIWTVLKSVLQLISVSGQTPVKISLM